MNKIFADWNWKFIWILSLLYRRFKLTHSIAECFIQTINTWRKRGRTGSLNFVWKRIWFGASFPLSTSNFITNVPRVHNRMIRRREVKLVREATAIKLHCFSIWRWDCNAGTGTGGEWRGIIWAEVYGRRQWMMWQITWLFKIVLGRIYNVTKFVQSGFNQVSAWTCFGIRVPALCDGVNNTFITLKTKRPK